MKAKIFVGESMTGKTRVAKMISEHIGEEKTFFINARSLKKDLSDIHFALAGISDSTQLLIIDDCPKSFDYTTFYCVEDKRAYGGDLKFRFLVEERRKKKWEILIPQIIITTTELHKKWKADDSFNARFNIIQFPLSKNDPDLPF